jgi:hypothetical protein
VNAEGRPDGVIWQGELPIVGDDEQNQIVGGSAIFPARRAVGAAGTEWRSGRPRR